MRSFRRVAVYCGSSNDVDPEYMEAARTVGRVLAERGTGIVYGGGNVGLMGALADAALEGGAEVLGVIPQKLEAKEVGHHGIGELVVCDSMHGRKQIMAAMSDAFIGLPGGYGTLDELFEAVTWTQLGYHNKPVGLLNVRGYFDGLVAFLDHARSEGFVRPMHRALVAHAREPEQLLDALAAMEIPDFERWIDKI